MSRMNDNKTDGIVEELNSFDEENQEMFDTYEKRDRLSQYKKMNIKISNIDDDTGNDD